MNLTLFVFVAILTIVVTAACWLLLRLTTGSTKYAWALALAVGYAMGHTSLLALDGVADGSFGQQIAVWGSQWAGALLDIMRPSTTVAWMPIGALLAGLVSVNAAVFGFEKTITAVGASLISVMLVYEFAGGRTIAPANFFSIQLGVPVVLGIVAVWIAWLSLQWAVADTTAWRWIACVAVLTMSVTGVLWLSGAHQIALLGVLMLAAMIGGTLVSCWGNGTDEVRYSGAVIAAAFIGLLLAASWSAELTWYPIALLVLGFLSVSIRLPAFVMKLPYGRTALSLVFSVAAILVTVLV